MHRAASVACRFCSSSTSGEGVRAATSAFGSEAEFDAAADDFLVDLMTELEDLDEVAGDAFEVDYAQGVLTCVIDPAHTYVINKQRPNKQIWFSSPLSGPRRLSTQHQRNSGSASDPRLL